MIISGRVQYWDTETQSYLPLKNAGISIGANFLGYLHLISQGEVYTDQNGEYEYSHPETATQIFVRVRFINSRISVRDYGGPYETTVLRNLGQGYTNVNFDFGQGSLLSEYAHIFAMGNIAAEFSIEQGYVPGQCNIVYPAHANIINPDCNCVSDPEVEDSFFWPFNAIEFDWQDLAGVGEFLTELFCGGDCTARFLENGIYLKDHDLISTTIFHEYGHYLFRHVRGGTWPITLQEYAANPFEGPRHQLNDYNQSPRKAFIEGWADFYASAVSSYYYDPSNIYEGRFYNIWDFLEKPWRRNGEEVNGHYFNYSLIPQGLGYYNEITAGSFFFDLYDPPGRTMDDGDEDGIQTPFLNIINTLADQSNDLPSYISVFAHKPFLNDIERHQGISILQNLKMDPLLSYQNITITVKNKFETGDVILGTESYGSQTIHSLNETTPGIIVRERLWMDDLYLRAIENQLDPQGYTMKFQHTHPTSPLPTWLAIEYPEYNQFNESWQTFNKQYTYTANFDRECHINVNYQSLDEVTLPTVSQSIQRDRTQLNINAPTHTINGVQHNFLKWSDGSIENPRNFTVSEHVALTAEYKAHLHSSSSAATAGNNQRKIVGNGNYKYMVYESGNKIWFTSFNGSTWSQEQLVSGAGSASDPAINFIYSPDGVHFAWKETMGNNTFVFYRKYDPPTNVWSPIVQVSGDGNSLPHPGTSPVIGKSSITGLPIVIWSSNAGLLLRHISYEYYTSTQVLYVNGVSLGLYLGTSSLSSYVDGVRSLLFIEDGVMNHLEFTMNDQSLLTGTQLTVISDENTTCSHPSIVKGRYYEGGEPMTAIVAAWDAQTASGRRIFIREWKSNTSSWGPITQINHLNHDGENPTLSFHPSGKVTVLWECGDHIARAIRSFSASTWSSVADIGQGFKPSVEEVGENQKVVWTVGSTQPYPLNFYTLSAPLAPSLVSPANGATGIGSAMTVTWNPAVDADQYHIQVYEEGISPLTIDNNSVSGVSYNISGLLPNTTYFWRISSINSYGESEFSPTFSFTTGTPPAAPSLTSPANNALLATQPVTLSWSAVSGAVSYRLQLDLDANFTSPIFKDTAGITGTSCQVSGLTLNTPYYWRVLAVNSFSEGSYSSVRSFKVDPPPSAPYLSWASVTVGNKKYPKLSWTRPATDIQQYKLYRYICLVEEGDCEIGTPHSLISTQTDTSFIDYAVEVFVKSPGHPMPTSTAFYYVKATDNSNQISPQSNKQGVSTEEPEIAWKQGTEELPDETSLIGSFPNPFNPSAEIRYQLSDDEYVTLKVYNTLGEEVATLTDGFESAGYKTRTWDAGGLPSGVYFCQLRAGSYIKMMKMILAR